MSLQTNDNVRAAMKQRLLSLQDRALRQSLSKRKQHDPHAWAWQFADKPREFISEIIEEWNEPEWLSWRSFISAVFCQPFASDSELEIFQQCTSLEYPPSKRPPSVWMPVGRRGGKSRILAAIAVHLGCCYDWTRFLDPGELGVIPVLAADRRQARTIMGYVKAFLEHEQLAGLVNHDSAESIQLKGSVLIEVVTASYRAVRSRTVLAALCDEIAFWHSEDSSTNPDTEIIAALEPAMATIPNALLLGASSPYARRGVLWNNFDRHFGKPDGPLIWRATTRQMNPTVPQSFIDEKYEEDPHAAAAEYGAEFRADVDAFITKEVLDAAVDRDRHEHPPRQGMQYFAFIDPSGGSSDSMTLAIGHIDRDTNRGVLDVIRERRPQFSPEAVTKDFTDLLKLYRVFRVEGDHYAGDWVRQPFKLNGVEYQVSKKRKSDIYLEFLPLLNAGRVEILDDRRLYNQLLMLERRVSRGGHESIDHSPGAHDDLANVVAGVMVKMLGRKQMLMVDAQVLQRSAMTRDNSRPRLDDLRSAIHGPQWR
jgi:hypothetical protein